MIAEVILPDYALCHSIPKLLLNNESSFFQITQADIEHIEKKRSEGKVRDVKFSSQKDALFNPDKKNNPFQRKKIQSIIKYLSNRGISITQSYEEWFRVAYAIANSFTHDVDEKYYLKLCELDKSKYNKVDCQNMLTYCYENNNGIIRFATLEHFAKHRFK